METIKLTCDNCGVEFDRLLKQHKSSIKTGNKHTYCSRKCVNKRIWPEDKEGFTAVYYLPEEHYIGITHCFSNRMKKHRKNGMCVEDIEVICYFESRIDAVWMEVQFHQRGYNGFGR